MKWLIIIILVSCGKHEEPKTLDIKDDDGDQILNYQETAFSKYIANIDHLGKLKGVLRFTTDRVIESPFSNELNILNKAKELMVINEYKYQPDEYFIEWSRLNIEFKTSNLQNLREKYDIELEFDNDSVEVDELVLSFGDSVFPIGKWESSMKFQLSAMHLNMLLTGKAHFKVKNKIRNAHYYEDTSEESIRDRTYRVYYSNGEENKIIYVSKELNFEALAEMMDIKDIQSVESEDIFFSGRDLRPRWFRRQFSNGDFVLVKSNFNELQKSLFKNYHYQKTVISRVNGLPEKSHRLKSGINGKTFIKIKPLERSVRVFKEYIQKKSHHFNNPPSRKGEFNIEISLKCDHHIREVKEEKISVPNYLTLLNNTLLTSHGERFQLDQSFIHETFDKEGRLWEVYLANTPENLEINVGPLGNETFVATGEYENSCQWLPHDKRAPSKVTNKEGKLSFEVESYVEKI